MQTYLLLLLIIIAGSNFVSFLFSESNSPNLIDSNAISALLGAIIGSVTGYFFNQKLEQSKTKERIAIQKKNTIFSPIYKELLLLKDYLKDVKTGEESFCRIDFISTRDSAFSHRFAIWESIKKDVRYDYIPNSIKMNLEELTDLLKEKMRLQDIIPRKCDEIAKKFWEDNQHKINRKKLNEDNVSLEGSLSHQVYSSLGILKHENESIEAFLQSYLLPQYVGEAEEFAKSLRHQASSLEEYGRDKLILDKTILQLDKTINEFRTLITAIINKYEGGVDYV